jgi:hypothetical protein
VAIDASSPPNPTDDIARCGGPGDPRTPGDGTVSFQPDADLVLNDSVPFEDKEYIDAGPRPDGVAPRCFAPETKTPISPGSPGCPEEWIGPDRVYVTWTRFDLDGTSRIHLSYSDDRARSWSVPRAISGSAPFCVGGNCDQNQFSVPTVSSTSRCSTGGSIRTRSHTSGRRAASGRGTTSSGRGPLSAGSRRRR